ncbi:hypothetical protein KR093_009624, partial [Drosophila rubida]
LTVEFTKMNANIKSPELLDFNYSLNRTSNNISAIYVTFKLSEDLFELRGPFNLRFKYTEKYYNYITLDIDYCKGLVSLYNSYIMKGIVDELRTVSNYPLDCPLKKNKHYYINGFAFNTNILPSYFPEISFALDATFRTSHQRNVLKVDIFGELRKK